MRGDTIENFKKYLNRMIEQTEKPIAAFRERLDEYPVWALEGVEHVMESYQKRQRATELLRTVDAYYNMITLPEDDLNRIRFTESMDGEVTEMAFLNYIEKKLLADVLQQVRTGSSLSTSPGDNLSREIRQIVDAKILDDRKWGAWTH